MPRVARLVLPGLPHHITQRGNYRQKVFYRDEDRLLYLNLLREFAVHYGVSILAYCLMPNHVHLIAVPHHERALARMLQRVHADYARAVHLRLRRVGHLWQARYASVPMDEKHFWATMVYVEQNPSKAHLVDHPWDWRWSSAQAHLADSEGGLLDLVAWRARYTPEKWKRCLELGLADSLTIERIREATQKGWPLGDEAFLDRLASEFGVNPRRRHPGRPRVERKAAGSVTSTVADDEELVG